MMRAILGCTAGLAAAALAMSADPAPAKTPKQALRAFNDLIGSWRNTGTPEGTLQEKQDGFWTESMSWSWQFKKDDAWLVVAFDKGKHFVKGELRYLPDKDQFRLSALTPAKDTQVFTGALKGKLLTLDRTDDAKKQEQRLVFSLLHPNRILFWSEVKTADGRFAKRYQVGATKEGVAFASGDGRPECIVSGGLGTTPVTYQGKTYYVCCSGCRDAFQEEPEKYIKEYEARKAKGK